eukprot:1195645-Prorocentrum_minimum.AAC.6
MPCNWIDIETHPTGGLYVLVYESENSNQKEKFEADLKKEIKKLQRYRDQIKTWSANSDIKDKKQLLDARKLIEREMERFKVCEKETKTKAFSKEGLGQQPKTDPKERARGETRDWLNHTVDELNTQVDMFEAEMEGLVVKKGKARPPRLTHLEESVSRHKEHVLRLEQVPSSQTDESFRGAMGASLFNVNALVCIGPCWLRDSFRPTVMCEPMREFKGEVCFRIFVDTSIYGPSQGFVGLDASQANWMSSADGRMVSLPSCLSRANGCVNSFVVLFLLARDMRMYGWGLQILRLVDNDVIQPEEVGDMKVCWAGAKGRASVPASEYTHFEQDFVDDYLERNQDDFDEFADIEELYESLGVDLVKAGEDSGYVPNPSHASMLAHHSHSFAASRQSAGNPSCIPSFGPSPMHPVCSDAQDPTHVLCNKLNGHQAEFPSVLSSMCSAIN